jgi:hypothetical protein
VYDVTELLTAGFLSLSLLSANFTFLPEGDIVGFQIFEWGFKSQKIRFGVKRNLGDSPPPGGRFVGFFFSEKTLKVMRIA